AASCGRTRRAAAALRLCGCCRRRPRKSRRGWRRLARAVLVGGRAHPHARWRAERGAECLLLSGRAGGGVRGRALGRISRGRRRHGAAHAPARRKTAAPGRAAALARAINDGGSAICTAHDAPSDPVAVRATRTADACTTPGGPIVPTRLRSELSCGARP